MSAQRDEDARVRYVDIVAFACEVAMFVVLVAAVNSLVSGLRHWVVSIAAVVVVGAVWWRWIAPSSPHRLGDPARFILQAALFITVGALAVLGDMLWVGVVFAVVSVAVFAATRSDRAL